MGGNHPIWLHFTKIGPDKEFKQGCAKCNYCDHKGNESVIRCEGHLKVCNNVSLEIKQRHFGSTFQEPEKRNSTVNTSRQRSSNIQSFVDTMSQVEQNDIELSFAQAIFQCGLPLSLPELKPIKDLFKKARPALILPGRKKLSTTLLNKAYEKTKDEVNKIINKAEFISIISDGWSNLVSEHWTNYILATPVPIFVFAKPTGEVQQNSNNIVADLEKIILDYNPKKVSVIITDNAYVMKKAWKILDKKYPSIIFLGCLAHNLNLLVGDIIKLEWAQNILLNAIMIVKYFKNHTIPAAILKRYQEDKYGSNYKTLKLPVETRWGSSASCLSSIKVNQLAISLATTELINHPTAIIDSEIIEIVQNNNFWNEIQNLFVILKIIVSGITIFESNISYLSQFYKWYENLETNEYLVRSSASEQILDIILKRWNSMYNPIIEIAYLIDSRFQGKTLANDIMTTVSDFVKRYYLETCTKIYSQLLEFLNHSGPFNNTMAWETVNDVDQLTWWTRNFSNSAPELTQFAKRILTIPTSSAAAERNWSNFSHIHSKKRNRLKSPRVFKLGYIFSNSKLQNIYDTKKEFIKKISKSDNLGCFNIDKIDLKDKFWEDLFDNDENESDFSDEEDLEEDIDEFNIDYYNEDQVSNDEYSDDLYDEYSDNQYSDNQDIEDQDIEDQDIENQNIE
ncbi:zinc finger bed domain-containing protein 1-like [Gigaspora margarita]|uniref:Zinc finger bed domain-containing protein 1-like n=1 Tax=Gigaspora margarita TaxID=4874 RepID=A0A8H4A0I7_GIGMA|nr:zinc finger bed domain-containing protein 1-like [Gigaspora margarita]